MSDPTRRPGAPQSTQPVADQKRIRFILWGAMLASTGVYAGLIASGTVAPPPEATLQPVMLYALLGVSVGVAVLSFVLPERLARLGFDRVASLARVVAKADPDAALGYRGKTETEQVIDNSDETLRALYGVTFVVFILEIALSESIAVYGLVLRTMGAGLETSLPFVAAGALLIALRFPRQKRWTDLIEKRVGARFSA